MQHLYIHTREVSTRPGCLVWMRGCNGSGYPVVRIEGKNYYVHRLLWEREHGQPAPPRLRNTCGLERCVNPEHWRSQSPPYK